MKEEDLATEEQEEINVTEEAEPVNDSEQVSENSMDASGVESDKKENSMNNDPRDEEIKLLRTQLEEANQKVDELNNKFLRAAADNENYRKRMVREREDMQHRTKAGVIEEFLPALDNMKLGLSSSNISPEAKAIADGFVMIFDQFKNAMNLLGVEEIHANANDDFDPNNHDCLSQQPSNEVEANKIIATTRTGYKLNGKLLRPAAVILSTGPVVEAEPLEETSESSPADQ
jgi:molecular chaperone GrpE